MKQNSCVICQQRNFRTLFTRADGRSMAVCLACGLAQVVPMPTAKEIGSLYHEDFDHFTPYIEQLAVHHAYFRQKVQQLSGYVPRGKRRPTLLDIGCAMGVLVKEALRAGYSAKGLDISADAIEYCRSEKLTAYNGTVYSAKELKTSSYDVVTAFQIIEHERDPIRMMKRIHSLLKNDGLAVLATPDFGGFYRKLMGKHWFGFTHPEHVILLNEQSMRFLLEKTGFKDIHILKDTPRPFPLSFALKRAGDYFPYLRRQAWATWILKPLGGLFDRFHIKNPINPWDDMIVFARK